MLNTLFTHDIYVKISKNRLEAKNLSTDSIWQSITPAKVFTTDRLLAGSFTAAEAALSQLLNDVLPASFLKKKARVVIHPMAMVESGLSEIEDRVFRELALGAGACKVVLHVGSELSDDDAAEVIRRT